LAIALLVIFVLSWVVGLAALLSAIWHLLRVPFNLRRGVERRSFTNPFNTLLNTDALSPEGLAARRRLGLSLAAFVGAFVVGSAAGALAMWVGQ